MKAQVRQEAEEEKTKMKLYFAEKKQEYMDIGERKLELMRKSFDDKEAAVRKKEEDLRDHSGRHDRSSGTTRVDVDLVS